VRIFLDTHIVLWWLTDDRRLSRVARQYIEKQQSQIYVSVVTIWEIAVKQALGRIDIDLHELGKALTANGFQVLPITFEHATEVANLPLHHRDPFDRMLLAQCTVESARLLTHDETLSAYGQLSIVV